LELPSQLQAGHAAEGYQRAWFSQSLAGCRASNTTYLSNHLSNQPSIRALASFGEFPNSTFVLVWHFNLANLIVSGSQLTAATNIYKSLH
jgi:hypothetical protein